MRLAITILGLLIAITLLLSNGCGDKLSLPSDLPPPDYSSGGLDTAYVQVNPIWTSAGGVTFDHPYDVLVGYDQYIYICDTRNNRVVKLDVDGSFLESYPVKNPVAITQDRGLDLLLVAGDYVETHPDTLYAGTDSAEVHTDTTYFGNAVYRKKHFGSESFKSVWSIEDPHYQQVRVTPERWGWVAAEFWGISASTGIDKSYFLADFWKGRILRFDKHDQPVPPALISEGASLGQTQFPLDLFFYEIVGQKYLAFAQGTGNFGAQVVSPVNGTPLFTETESGTPDLVRLLPRGHKQIAVDEQSSFYVLAEAPDYALPMIPMFYKFDRNGARLLAFGTEGSGERQFRNPRGLAYRNGIIYIADTGNNRIVRYQLSTDTRQ